MMEPGQHPNSKRNLVLGQWKVGQSGNPRGRPRGHVNPSELLAGLLALNDDGTPKYREADLEAILKDPDAAPALKLACRWIVTGLKSGERWVLGRSGELQPASLDPVPLRALESLADRQEGRPKMKLEIESEPMKTPQEWNDEVVRLIEASPKWLANPNNWTLLLDYLRHQPADRRDRLKPLLLIHCADLLEQIDDLAPIVQANN